VIRIPATGVRDAAERAVDPEYSESVRAAKAALLGVALGALLLYLSRRRAR
jgi:hypothetical protein